MSYSATLAQLKPHTLHSRSIFVKCVPAPRNFYERRAVLAALQKASQQSIETFKKLEDSSSFIAVTTKPEAAESLMFNSPLERTIVSQGPNDEASTRSAWSPNNDTSGPIVRPVDPLPSDSNAKPTPAASDLGLSYRSFTLHIFPTNLDYNHRDEVRKSPLHGQWPRDAKTETFISAALRKVVPPGAMAPALRDWETGNQLARGVDSTMEDGREGAAYLYMGSKRLSAREKFLLERIRRRGAEQEVPKVMSSLVQFSEECRAATATTARTTATAPRAFSLRGTDTKSPRT